MKRHIDTAPNPYNATIELAMPGVQERFNGLTSVVTTKVDDVKTDVLEVKTEVKEVKSEMHDIKSSICRLESKIESRMCHVQTSLSTIITSSLNAATTAAVAAASATTNSQNNHTYDSTLNHTYDSTVLDGRNQHPNSTATPSRNNIEQRRIQRSRDSAAEPPVIVQACLSLQFSSLSLLWDEWHGSGGVDTFDKPIPGGFEKLEQIYKAKWRNHLDAAQRRHATRIRLIILGIKTMAQSSNISVDMARDQLEVDWTRKKKSPDAMVKHLQEMGYLKKLKPRGRTAARHLEEDNSIS